MWAFTDRINLIRYLIVWRTNSPLVWLPACLSAELSWVLGTIIADRLPTREARPWRKFLASWEEGKSKKHLPFPETAWPIKSVLFVYPGKRSYGEGELILWELKLLAESADHGFFLEFILPAMEEAATTSDPRWRQKNNLWGQFDICSIYAARGDRWEPFVQEGKLDLHYHPTPVQWAEGLAFDARSDHVFKRLSWLTPFDLSTTRRNARRRKEIPDQEVPTLLRILESLLDRMAVFLPGKHNTSKQVWNALNVEERTALEEAMEQAKRVPVRRHKLFSAPKGWPGRWIGIQYFPFVPPSLIPYLELASILHIGKQTHFGCGTFALS